jgi:hypothetical protein
MSEASRAAALQHAAMIHQGSGDPVAALETAEAFHSFITGGYGAAEPAPAAKPKVPAKPATVTKPKVAAKPEPEVEPDADAVTKEQVGEAIEAMLNADMRKQAVALFKKYGATSLSSLAEENYAAVKEAAEGLLLNA